MELKGLLELLFTRKASDLHLRVGSVPVLRIDGNLFGTRPEPVSEREMNSLLNETVTAQQLEMFVQEKELDLALTVPGHGRVRVNAYYQKGTPALAFRAIKTQIPSFTELNLPASVEKLCNHRRGIILLTGATGSGKSTTMAAMIEHINQTRSVNILTIEDPIEFVFSNKKSLIAQREVMIDTESFLAALTHALREDPDIIMVGEIRDQNTMKIALQAAETGHLVLTSLHTLDAVEAVNRIISFFPLNEQAQIRSMIAGSLQAVISQRLVPRSDAKGRVPLVEVMINTAAIKECLVQTDKMNLIHGLIEDDQGTHGMQTFDQSIYSLFKKGVISLESALENANNPNDLEMAVRGIKSSGSRLVEVQ
ncbi:MAG: PilT/PilU family type 4a pilus ATPase [Calditrichaeota bacterium]|nr:PilT/PilU family type 4a pilus ATPase [Calditrichota bacterium]MCB9391042.1 PilT/PilU family type 4a pilus ATPase [Calditrichota bacterium]